MRIAVMVGAVASSLAVAAPARALEKVPDEVIVQYERGSDGAERADARADAETRPLEGLGSPGLQLVRIADGGSVAKTIGELEAEPAVERAEPNGIDEPQAIPNDTAFPLLWGLHNLGQTVNGAAGAVDADIDAPAAWDIGTGDAGTVVAIMDSGADLTHPDLSPQLWQNPGEVAGNGVDDNGNGFVDDVNGYDFFAGDPSPIDFASGHGTHVAGTALGRGDDGFGITGVSQRASLMVLRVCGFVPDASDPPGDVGCPQSAQIQAINYAAANRARVLNGSLGGGTGSENTIRRDAIFSHPEVLHVLSAGNGGPDSIGDDNDATPSFPCSHTPPSPSIADNIVCVAATTPADGRASFSNFGATKVDLGAPGVNTLSDSGVRSRPVDDFSGAFTWTATPGQTNWVRTNEAPLTSFGVAEAVGNYAINTTYGTNSPAVNIPAGLEGCELRYFRSRALGAGDTFRIEVLLNGSTHPDRTFNFTVDAAAANASVDLFNTLAAGGAVRVRLTLISGAAGVDAGVHMDNIRLACVESPSDNSFEFKNGTSMAAPHVTGAAALLFSRNPGAPADEIRSKLLGTVDPLPALAGITATGGRLNIGTAMATMAADTALTGGPGEGEEIGARRTARRGGAAQPGARPTFGYASNDPAASFQCSVDGGAFAPCAGATSTTIGPLGPGTHSFGVRSFDPRGNADATPATRTFAVESDPPNTRIRKAPRKRTRSRKAKITFKSDEPGSTFECKLDKKKFKSCRSPRKLKRLDRKKHKFQVRAIDAVGNADPSPAKKSWTVKR